MSPAIVRRALPGWGTTYGPAGDGPFPAVMILHGSEGAWSGWSHRHAVMLAAHGFLAFPLRFSVGGNAWNAGQIIEVPLERTVAAGFFDMADGTRMLFWPLMGRRPVSIASTSRQERPHHHAFHSTWYISSAAGKAQCWFISI